MAAVVAADPALDAYEALAPFYDRYTALYDHDLWLANLESVAMGLGLEGRGLLDVGCGTGKSFLPLLARGYDVVACDVSPEMVARARERAMPGPAEVIVADARELPDLGSFDLVTCLDDCLNYLLSDEELGAALEGVSRNLRPGGFFIFDLNSLATYRGFFSLDAVSETDGAVFCWRGEGDPEAGPRAFAAATIEVFSTDDGECWRRTSSRHVQRHHPFALVNELLDDAGLELLEVRGQFTGARLERPADEERHAKLVYFARKSPDQAHDLV
jgi:SAM-dependent methyltransferase